MECPTCGNLDMRYGGNEMSVILARLRLLYAQFEEEDRIANLLRNRIKYSLILFSRRLLHRLSAYLALKQVP